MDVGGASGFAVKLFYGVRHQNVVFVYPCGTAYRSICQKKNTAGGRCSFGKVKREILVFFKVHINRPSPPLVSVLPAGFCTRSV